MGKETFVKYYCDGCGDDCTAFKNQNYGIPTVWFEPQKEMTDKSTPSWMLCRQCRDSFINFMIGLKP